MTQHPGIDLINQQRWRDVCEVVRTAIDHPQLLNDPVCVLATIKQDFKARLEQETQQETQAESKRSAYASR